ncbi:MAG: FRG domain-containing protein [candidate division FCPU426 bacterium]
MITDDNFDTFEAIFTKLKPEVPISDQFLYRGQGTDKKLIPSSLRTDADSKIELLKPLILDTQKERDRYAQLNPQVQQNYIEFRIINRFIHLTDDAGVPLPGDDSRFRDDLLSLRTSDTPQSIELRFQSWPKFSEPKATWNAVFALAQHYGLPTRYLDWSSYSYVALYFAASDAIVHNKMAEKSRANHKTEFFYVCRLDRQLLEEGKVSIFPIQGSLNPNLSAQKGKNTFLANTDDETQRKGYEEIVGITNAMTQYKIPIKFAVDVLEYLKSHNISRDTLFPSLRSIVESMYERAYYLTQIPGGQHT